MKSYLVRCFFYVFDNENKFILTYPLRVINIQHRHVKNWIIDIYSARAAIIFH